MTLSQEKLKELLHYDPLSGVFTWKQQVNSNALAGSVAGCQSGWGYWRIAICGRQYLAHRLAWLYVHGEMPSGEIDHINRNKTDNRIANLRSVSRSVNQQNNGLRADNKSGFVGVHWHSSKQRWRAVITLNGKKHRLGNFTTKEAAAEAYAEAKARLHDAIHA